MNQELQKGLAQFLQLTLDAVQKGAAFASQQLPLVIQEKLHYEIVSSAVWVGIWLSIIAIVWGVQQTLWRLAAKWRSNRHGVHFNDTEEAMRGVPTFIASVLSVVGVADIIWNINHIVYVWIAPRVFIIDWLKELLK